MKGDYMGNIQKQPKNHYIVYSDGGCSPNPGGPGGYGAVIIKGGQIVKELSHGYFASTNNRMEIMGVIAAMEWLPKGSVIDCLYCDSQYVLKTISGEFKKKKNTDLWGRLDKALARHTIANIEKPAGAFL